MQNRNNKGFTLIELLIVVVIIGILAAIAIPKFAATRERAFVSAMKSDLRNLATQQEIFYNDPANAYTYSTDQAALDYTSSENVTVVVNTADATGWDATATHTSTTISCAMTIGYPAVVAPATDLGVVFCA